MKLLVVLTFLCICPFIYAQEIFYTHQNKTLQEIKETNTGWVKYNTPVYEGLNNGIYWFKIITNSSSHQILSIPESHISKTSLYYKNKLIPRQQDTRYITYNLLPKA